MEDTTRHARDRKKKKGDVGIEKEKEKEGERLESFISTTHNFFVPASSPPVTNFIGVVLCVAPAAVVVSSPVAPVGSVTSGISPTVSSTDYSVVSSVNFVPASAFTSSTCIGTIR